jgi:fimbrial chaperone protein
LTAFGWTQSAKGEIELAPTSDVVFFPALLTLKPGEERKVRVGTTAQVGAREKTYRIFVEELPSAASTGGGAAVRVLTKMGIPIFLRPAVTAPAALALETPRLADGRLHFALANDGAVHAVPETITVRGTRGDEEIFTKAIPGWYILGGGRREFEVELPAADCGRISDVTVQLEVGKTQHAKSIALAAGACAHEGSR